MAEESKRRRLQRLVCVPGVSDSAITRILTELSKHPDVFTASRRTCNRAVYSEYTSDMALTIDLPLDNGTTFEWHLVKPGRLVQRSCEVSPALRRLFSTSVIVHKIIDCLSLCHHSHFAFVGDPYIRSLWVKRSLHSWGPNGAMVREGGEPSSNVDMYKGEFASLTVVIGIGTRRDHTGQRTQA